ncbi:MAG: NAD(P)-binding domain-containing protein [Bdellovibrionaceae bacterium]|nr:NAD(P)-binding domain-containing protein [Pseudobdellovibrionaceae bacterium]
MAAGVTAIAGKKSYLLLEQNTFGGTVYNFPRQKIVMSYPFDLPIVGKFKFESNKISKEQLLQYWNGVRKKTGLKVNNNTKFETVEKIGNIFKVKSSLGEHTAKKVILCLGVRGSPRKLGAPGEELAKVTYNLLDPEQYQNKKYHCRRRRKCWSRSGANVRRESLAQQSSSFSTRTCIRSLQRRQ